MQISADYKVSIANKQYYHDLEQNKKFERNVDLRSEFVSMGIGFTGFPKETKMHYHQIVIGSVN